MAGDALRDAIGQLDAAHCKIEGLLKETATLKGHLAGARSEFEFAEKLRAISIGTPSCSCSLKWSHSARSAPTSHREVKGELVGVQRAQVGSHEVEELRRSSGQELALGPWDVQQQGVKDSKVAVQAARHKRHDVQRTAQARSSFNPPQESQRRTPAAGLPAWHEHAADYQHWRCWPWPGQGSAFQSE